MAGCIWTGVRRKLISEEMHGGKGGLLHCRGSKVDFLQGSGPISSRFHKAETSEGAIKVFSNGLDLPVLTSESLLYKGGKFCRYKTCSL